MTALGASDGDVRSYIELVDPLRQDGVAPDQDAMELWRRMLFNVLISNTDDDLRNHGYLREPGGWRIAPGILALMVVEIGLVHPPVGMNVYIINRLAKDVPLVETFKGVMPFLASDFIRITVLLFFPVISLVLVHTFKA